MQSNQATRRRNWASGVWRGLLGAVVLLACAAPLRAEQPLRLRVLCYNIHHAEGVDGKLDLERIAGVILSVKPDIVALQEVDQRATRSESVDQPAELARLTGMQVAFGANIPLQGGHYGNAMLSRFPITDHQNRLLPNRNNGEQRGVLSSTLKVPGLGEPLRLLATHLDHRGDDGERIASAKAINQLIDASSQQPTLLAGDMNDVIGSPTLQIYDKMWTRANDQPLPTIPVAEPTRQIDFILFRPRDDWKVVEVKVLDEAVASDHRPILAVLEYVGGE
ncbi:Endonuclease/Exonuclease/phosphatase family protein [Roseimaritima ulvae]|uniref:Endonuclease/Exonuclease/phosphatase family protein n=2 Tax=Roseimaritima ulvae TaxID=980254 RepID=A0A5B9QY46_9BACT|nr:Endonuclease/Exonuclease/phosphatase family protein [Roseimaritima ulvae]